MAEADGTVSILELRELQRALGCKTQGEFADVLGVDQSYISKLYTGEKVVRPGTLLNFIRHLQALHVPGKRKQAPGTR